MKHTIASRPLPGFHAWLAAFLVLGAAGLCAETVETINKTFAVTPGGHLVVDVDLGGIEVRAAEAPQVVVEAVRKVKASSKEKEEVFLRQHEVVIDQQGDTVTVRARRGESPGSWWNRVRTSTDFRYTITVPARFNAGLKTSGGGIGVTGLTGDVHANTSGGGLKFERISGSVDGKTSGGGITIAACKGGVKVHTSGGGITVRTQRGAVIAHTSGGGITLEQIEGTFEADTSGGSIRAALAAQPKGDCRLTTSGGGIRVALPDGVAVEIDASTSAGSVHSEFAVAGAVERKSSRLAGTINGGGHLLYLRSSAGSIHVNKLTAGGPEA